MQARFIHILTVITWLMWPLCTYAASVTIGSSLGDVPLNAWISVIVLSAVSGLVALLQRMTRAIEVYNEIQAIMLDQPLAEASQLKLDQMRHEFHLLNLGERWVLPVTYHMMGALLMGAICFLFFEAGEAHDFVETVFIALSAYGGAKLVDRLGLDWFNSATKIFSKG